MSRVDRVIDKLLQKVDEKLCDTLSFFQRKDFIYQIRDEMYCQKILSNGKRCKVVLCPHHEPEHNVKRQKTSKDDIEDVLLKSLMEYNIEQERKRLNLFQKE